MFSGFDIVLFTALIACALSQTELRECLFLFIYFFLLIISCHFYSSLKLLRIMHGMCMQVRSFHLFSMSGWNSRGQCFQGVH